MVTTTGLWLWHLVNKSAALIVTAVCFAFRCTHFDAGFWLRGGTEDAPPTDQQHRHRRAVNSHAMHQSKLVTTRYRPGAARWYAPADSSLIQKSRRIYVRPRTGPQSAHLWWPAVAKLQAASVPIAWAAASWNRQTDRSRYTKMLSQGGGITNYQTVATSCTINS